MPTIGALDSAAATTLKLSTFYEGLKVEGFSRNQNLTVEYHSAEGDYARLPELAADLVDRRVTLITCFGGPAALAAKAATTKIPIVFAVSANPIEIGLVASHNRPGANVTGVTSANRSFISALAFDRRHIASDRGLQYGFAVLGDNTIEIVTIDGLEGERLQCCTDFVNGARGQWNEVRVAPHE